MPLWHLENSIVVCLYPPNVQCVMWQTKQGDCKNGLFNPNFKGFMVNNAQINWNSMWTMYNFGDPSEPMVDREQIYFFHYNQLIMNWHTKKQIKLYRNVRAVEDSDVDET
jgi:hypothetical protein